MDLGTVANAVRRVGAADARPAAERIAVPPQLLLTLLQGQAKGDAGVSELARDMRAQLASGAAVTLILPPAATSEAQGARIDISGRQFAVPAALRDALLAQLAQLGSAGEKQPTPGAMPGPALATPAAALVVAEEAARAWVVNAQTQAAATQLLAGQAALGAGAGREALRALTPRATAATRDQALPSVGFDQPVVDTAVLETSPLTAVGAIAQRLQQQFERSGLFFESHLAQWAQGARGSDELRAELVQLGRSGQPPTEASAQRVAAQLGVLEQQAVVLTGPAWAGQPMQLAIAREPRKLDVPVDMPPVFNATLALDLPHLGRVEVDLRIAGKSIATTVRGADVAELGAALGHLTEQFSARGLTPVAARAVSLDAALDDPLQVPA